MFSTSASSTIPEKRKRRTGKRDDRTQPKHVQSLPKRSNGTVALPVTIGRGTNEVIIYDIGTVVQYFTRDLVLLKSHQFVNF
jgi:hypothetical protein